METGIDPAVSTRPSLAAARAGLTKNEALALKFGKWFPQAKEKAMSLAQAADKKTSLMGIGLLVGLVALFWWGGRK